jgi:hypothetical protein
MRKTVTPADLPNIFRQPSLREIIEGAALYMEQQARLAIEEEKERKREAEKEAARRPSKEEVLRRRAHRLSLNKDMCSKCQANPRYKTASGVAYGSLCYPCMTEQRLKHVGKPTKPAKTDEDEDEDGEAC